VISKSDLIIMTGVLYFCTAKELIPEVWKFKSKSLLPKTDFVLQFMEKATRASNLKSYANPAMSIPNPFFLVESRAFPSHRDGFKKELRDGDVFESSFIGATVDECTQWAVDHYFNVNYIDQNILIIADARSAKDDTVLVGFYARELTPDPEEEHELQTGEEPDPYEGPGEYFPKFGHMPAQRDYWYDYRVDYKDTYQIYVSLSYTNPGIVYPSYFGKKEQFTDENGVFDVAKAFDYGLVSHYDSSSDESSNGDEEKDDDQGLVGDLPPAVDVMA
jgi:hypothetical protein